MFAVQQQRKRQREQEQDDDEPYKKKTISHLLKRRVWAEHVGEEVGKTKCMCCSLTDITQLTFVCGHVVAERAGGPTAVDNLLPICHACNSSMGTQNMYEFMLANGLFNDADNDDTRCNKRKHRKRNSKYSHDLKF